MCVVVDSNMYFETERVIRRSMHLSTYPFHNVTTQCLSDYQGQPIARRGWARTPGLKILEAYNIFLRIMLFTQTDLLISQVKKTKIPLRDLSHASVNLN